MSERLMVQPKKTYTPTSLSMHNGMSQPRALPSPSPAKDVSRSAIGDARLGHDFSQVRVYADTESPGAGQGTNTPSLQERRPVQEAALEATSLNQQSHRHQKSSRPLTVVEHHRQSFSASIRRADNTRPSAVSGYLAAGEQAARRPGLVARHTDAMPGAEETTGIDLGSLLAQTVVSASAASIPEPQEGETVHLPDIVIPSTAAIEQTDAIASTLTYNSSITQSGPPPSPFGATLPYTHALSGISVTLAAGTYTVTATVDNPITFQVASGGQTDISSDTDPDITQANYSTVASDLTPNMTDLNGRPPRSSFWAEDLCIRHERFHATEDVAYGRSGVTLAQNWLNTQTAASVAAVNTLLGQVPARVAATVSAAMAYPGRENRAYGDGAPSYLARATAIKTKGDANGYAPPAPAPAPPARPPGP